MKKQISMFLFKYIENFMHEKVLRELLPLRATFSAFCLTPDDIRKKQDEIKNLTRDQLADIVEEMLVGIDKSVHKLSHLRGLIYAIPAHLTNCYSVDTDSSEYKNFSQIIDSYKLYDALQGLPKSWFETEEEKGCNELD